MVVLGNRIVIKYHNIGNVIPGMCCILSLKRWRSNCGPTTSWTVGADYMITKRESVGLFIMKDD